MEKITKGKTLKNKEVKNTQVETPASKEKELTEKQLEKVAGGLKAAPTMVEVDPKSINTL